MGVRLRYEYQDLQEVTTWRVDIDDADYGGSINTVNHGLGCEIIYDREGDRFLEPVKGSSAKVVMYDEGEAFWDTLRNNFVTANDQEFKMVVYRDTGSGYSLYWVGDLMPSMIEEENQSGAKMVTLEAVDGLRRLKDIYFESAVNNDMAGVGRGIRVAQAYNILWHILEMTDHSQFWGTNDDYVKYFGYWLFDGNTSYYELLDRTQVPLRIFTEENDDIVRKNQTPMSAYDSLVRLLKLFNLRIMLSNGSWIVYHVGVLHDTSAHTGYYCFYRKSGTASSTSPYRYNYDRGSVANVQNLGGAFAEFDGSNKLTTINADGMFGHFPALSRAQITALSGKYSFPDIQGGFANTTLNSSTAPMSESVSLGTIVGGGGRAFRFAFALDLNLLGLAMAALRSRWKLRIRVKVTAGSYRLWDNGQQLDDLQWTTGTPSHSVYIDLPIQGEHNIIFDTPVLPWTSESVTVDYTFDIIDSAGTSIGSNLFQYEIRYVGVSVLVNGDVVKDSKFQINNSRITESRENTIADIMDDFPLDDSGQTTLGNALGFNTTSTTFELIGSDKGWLAGDAAFGSVEFSTAIRLIKDAMALQDYPRRRYRGSFANENGGFDPHMVFTYDGTRWVMNAMRFDTMNGEVSGEWFGIEWYANEIEAEEETGRGWEFDGPDMVKPKRRVKRPYEFVGEITDGFYGEETAGTGGVLGDTISSLTISTATESLLKSGDVVLIYDPETLENLGEFTLTADVDSSDTTMSFTSKTLDHNIPVGAKVMLKGSEGFATPMLRTDEIQLGGETLTFFRTFGYIEYNGDVISISATGTLYDVTTSGLSSSEYNGVSAYNSGSVYGITIDTAGTYRVQISANFNVVTDTNSTDGVLQITTSEGASISGSWQSHPMAASSANVGVTFSGAKDFIAGEDLWLQVQNQETTDNIDFGVVRIYVERLS